MDQGIVARIEEWDDRPFSGGYDGLRDLADAEFSGAVTADGAWLFVLNGRIVGGFDGGLPAFEDADGTAYAAPDPSLPLLFAMQETGGETQGRYYTDDTPLADVEGTLSEGGFTGYVELSENVLSGDYYVVFYGGRPMSVAFVGGSERLLTGEDALERANDEVGIYEVLSVDLEVQDVPGSDPPVEGAAGSTDPTADPGDDAPPSADGPDEEATADGADATGEDGSPAGAPTRRTGPSEEADGAEPSLEGDDEDGGEDDPRSGAVEGAAAEADVHPFEASAEGPEPTEENDPDPPPDGEGVDGSPSDLPVDDTGSEDDDPGSTDRGDDPGSTERDDDPGSAERDEERAGGSEPRREAGTEEDPFSEEEAWRETRSIPALDPDDSEQVDGETGAIEADAGGAGDGRGGDGCGDQPASDPDASLEPPPGGSRSGLRELREAVESREARIEELRDRLGDVAEERDRLAEERDRLKRRVGELEERLEADAGSGTADTERDVDPAEALSSTDLFVRYGSKAEATLQDAHGAGASREDVNANLRIEKHTRFEADEVVVDGDAYAAFLESTLEFHFVEWLVEDLLYEIRRAGAAKGLRDLHDALPRIDRVAFGDTVTTHDDEGGESTRTFDVVCRDRMGQPLVVADLNDARDPATGGMMADLVERSDDVAGSYETVSAAFLVTASFFEPDALETAANATGGGLLNRGSRRSFVKLSRKHGYHLCLVEARQEAFHLAVPEL